MLCSVRETAYVQVVLALDCSSQEYETHRTVRAWSSDGAPESTAAGMSMPGSEPSITRIGTGEKALRGCKLLLKHAYCAMSAHDVL
jgi:hypothetical protein